MITGKQRAYLKQEAHDFKPVVNIGKFSVTDELIKAIDEALEARDLSLAVYFLILSKKSWSSFLSIPLIKDA